MKFNIRPHFVPAEKMAAVRADFGALAIVNR
jgi:hypothetical protein